MNPLFHARCPLVLASGSPRRQDFFREMGLDFQIVLPETELGPSAGEGAEHYALRAAQDKAEQVFFRLSHEDSPVVIAADTIVVLEADGVEHILGKPAGEKDALAMLSRLAGRAHTVITACCLLRKGREPEHFADKTRVFFANWPLELLQAYVATGEPLDKAGAYAVQGQGAFLVERLEGSWSTVVGLPLSLTMRALVRMEAIM